MVSVQNYNLIPGKIGFKLKKTEYNIVDKLSFLTALTSMTGFAVGGYGLLYDQFFDKKNQYSDNKKEGGNQPRYIPPFYQQSSVFNSFHNSINPTSFTQNNTAKKDNEGAKTINPNTKTAKIGLLFAKVGIAFSGIAGIFNGISMGLPLMATGEALNLGASPIIETPLGTGLFGMALAAVFSGRALEHDPLLRMDLIKLSQQKTLGKKATYILGNMAACVKEVLNSAKIFGQKIVGFTSAQTRKDSVDFFKNNVFAIKPKAVVIQELIDRKGVVTVKMAFKNNPYLMHAASLVLAVGGATLAISSIIKNKIGQKVGLKTYEVGGSIDNLSLSRSGWEKAAMANSASGKLAGNLLGLSGLTILAGQPGVDEKWGRGIQWVGSGLLFAVFAVERKANAFKHLAEKAELTSLIRQTNIDLTKLHPNGKLFEKIDGSEFKTRLDSIIDFVKEKKVKEKNLFQKLFPKIFKFEEVQNVEKPLEDNTLKHIVDFANNELAKQEYKNNNFNFYDAFEKHVKENNLDVNLENVKNAIVKEEREGNFQELKDLLNQETFEKFETIPA